MTYCSTTKRWHRGTVAKSGATPIKMLLYAQTLKQSQDSIVNIVLRLRTGQLKNHASIPGNDERFFSPTHCPDLIWGPVRFLFNGYQGLFTCSVKQPGCETDLTSSIYHHNKHRDNYFTLTTLDLVRQHCYSSPISKIFSLCKWNCYLSQENANLRVVLHPHL
jgi:hypothetical protein